MHTLVRYYADVRIHHMCVQLTIRYIVISKISFIMFSSPILYYNGSSFEPMFVNLKFIAG